MSPRDALTVAALLGGWSTATVHTLRDLAGWCPSAAAAALETAAKLAPTRQEADAYREAAGAVLGPDPDEAAAERAEFWARWHARQARGAGEVAEVWEDSAAECAARARLLRDAAARRRG